MDKTQTKDALIEEALSLAMEDFKCKAREKLLAFTLFTKPDYEINWHHKKLCDALDRFARGEIKRLIVSMPPRHGKSELVSRRLPSFILGQNPDAQIISASYGADLASRMNRDVQRIIDDEYYKELFPDTKLNADNVRATTQGSALKNSDIFEVVGKKGVYRSAGVGGAITGMGAHFAIIDDPIKNREEADSITYREKLWEWYTSTFYTRLEKEGSILITMTRWHEDDLVGRLLNLQKSDPEAEKWEVVDFPAIKEDDKNADDPRNIGEPLWEAKYNLDRLKAIKTSVGSRVWNALYQQKPSASEGGIIKRAWIKFYRTLPARLDEQIESWDLGFKETKKSDFVAGQVWGRAGADKYLIDRVKGRMDIIGSITAILTMSAKHPKAYAKLVEGKANGPAVITLLKSKVSGLIEVEPEGSKESRVHSVAPDWEAGNVWLPHPDIAPWVHDFIEELVNFPNASNDDEVDAMSQALVRLRSNSFDFSENMIPSKIKTITSVLRGADSW